MSTCCPPVTKERNWLLTICQLYSFVMGKRDVLNKFVLQVVNIPSINFFSFPVIPHFIFNFQTLFVIGIAFQGFFIFAFHCVRYTDVRQQWRKTLSPKKPLFSRWRRARRKNVDTPTQSQVSPQLTREDVLTQTPSPMLTTSPSQGNLLLMDSNSQGSDSEQVVIGLINLGRQNSTTTDTYLWKQ